jgi:hypothetical protein
MRLKDLGINKMIKKKESFKSRGVWEHLEHTLEHTTYAQRLQWLEEANRFVNTLRRKKGYPNLSWKL